MWLITWYLSSAWLIIQASILTRSSHWPAGASLTYFWCRVNCVWRIWILHNWMTPSALWHPWSPPCQEPVISGETQSNLLSHPPDTHMQHVVYFMILVWTLALSGKLAVCTKWRFGAWNKPTADTNNMVLMCHKLYLSALFQTQNAHPESCWERGLLAAWPCHFWMNLDWSFVQRILPFV